MTKNVRIIWGLSVLGLVTAFIFTAKAEMQANSFWTEAAQGGLAEVALSNAALQHAQSTPVKEFAQQMVTDHTAANQELTQLASTKSVTIPTALTEKQQRDLDKLNGRSGADFDREYMKKMVADHEKMVRLFQREAERNADNDVKTFAAKHLPTLQSHLSMARTIYGATRTAARDSDRGNASNNNSSDRNDNTNANTNSRNANRSNSNNSNVNNF